ncbi:MAG: transposase [Streptomyces sp.]|nr:transposase [Streptomyces sp.]
MDTLTMDLADPRKGVLVGRKSPYPEEFRNDAVALYRAAGGKRTYAAVAADVGVTGETLRSWVRQADEHAGRDRGRGEQDTESRDEELARLRAENGRLRKAEKEWELEREILRRAAAYFAREVK